MNLTVSITDRTPKPRVINVKQYSSGVDTITFIINDSIPDPSKETEGDVVCEVIGGGYIQVLTLNNNRAVWSIAAQFTQKSGSFGVQLKVSGKDSEWLSDVMLLIVSESEDGSNVITQQSGYGVVGDCFEYAYGITDNGVVGVAK
jgi:hypothetical protein